MRKGDCGKIGVIGGSEVYTGAPFFTALTPIKIGADLSYVYCHPSAATIIKSYSPELIVYPSTEFAGANRTSIEKLDALVFGPGLGRADHTSKLLLEVIQFVKQNANICLVIDADGLFYLNEYIDALAGCTNNIVITPNHREFARLYSHVFPKEPLQDVNMDKHTQKLAKRLGVCIVRKGAIDYISDGQQLLKGKTETSMRRCGGQGDILSGAIALFSYWAKCKQQLKGEKTKDAPLKDELSCPYKADNILKGAMAASELVRRASKDAFNVWNRTMVGP